MSLDVRKLNFKCEIELKNKYGLKIEEWRGCVTL